MSNERFLPWILSAQAMSSGVGENKYDTALQITKAGVKGLPPGIAKFCDSRTPQNCKLCIAQGQSKKIGCEAPITPESL